jgi:tetratricopeptide (TPR) repeat protein
MKAWSLTAVALAAISASLLAGCSSNKRLPGDNEPTLATLRDRTVSVTPDTPQTTPKVGNDQTIAAYREFLQAAPNAPQRPEAMRRLGDLEMDNADRRAAESTTSSGEIPDYKAAIVRYEEFLKAYPEDPRNDRVLYQLARAQEQGGQLESALKTLSHLVAKHPGTVHADEAHFRRGEMLFATREYQKAESAYATVLAGGNRTPFTERALYMQGWSLFKLGRLDDALKPFFGVLDLKLGGLSPSVRDEAKLEDLRALTRADRELVEDTFRVMSISLSNLQGAESVPRFIDSPARDSYQFRVYQQLAELYIRQERIKDAADTLAAFVRRQPLHAQAPLLQARVIEIYAGSGFETLALAAKKDHVVRYGADSEFRRANPSGWARAQPLVKNNLGDLARHHHALAQKNKQPADVQEAVRWYQALLSAFPGDADEAQNRFLMAELLFEDRRFAVAAQEFERVAYPSPALRSTGAQGAPAAPAAPFARAADAGYSALLSYAALEGQATDKSALQRQGVDSALRFAQAFASDPRAGAVLTNASEKLLLLGEGEKAVAVARQSLALTPPPAPELRRVAWTVVAHHSFDRAAYADAEAAYGEVLALTAERAAGRAELVERQAAAIYKQGEAARTAGKGTDAVGHFARVAALSALPAGSAVRASALVDAAASLIALKDWDAAARTLEDFRRQHPAHPLQAEVAPKLALAYLELGRHALAAAELEKVAASATDPQLARGALWQAAELHQKSADAVPGGARPKSPLLATAIRAWERYLQAHPQPLEPAVEARWKLVALTRQDGQLPRSESWVRAVQAADREAGPSRTPRTRALGGQATLLLAEPVLEAYKRVPLTEPLQRQLKLKKTKMDEVLKAYAEAAEAGVAEVTTAATFHTATLYQDFGKSLIGSQRPKKLSKMELEQYNVLLEEQAFPFEEKAIELHETNARRTAQGLYDAWVKSSLAELAKLKPVRYGKVERGDAALGADLAALQTALKQAPDSVPLLNQIGIAQRQQGQFDEARKSYEAAIAANANAPLPHLNLAILYDLYLGDVSKAQALYQRCVELSPGDATQLNRWIAELKGRKPAPNTPQDPATAAPAAAPGAAPAAQALPATDATAVARRKDNP